MNHLLAALHRLNLRDSDGEQSIRERMFGVFAQEWQQAVARNLEFIIIEKCHGALSDEPAIFWMIFQQFVDQLQRHVWLVVFLQPLDLAHFWQNGLTAELHLFATTARTRCIWIHDERYS
ncbi:hypothetical protein AB1L42_05100 [Thalassoglobus sp. JC818]|uniref:hypothetical protein n=1 Tax=Thalassoglobus sp. JC818 TaxID=3232136 RepID=UPI0034580EAF